MQYNAADVQSILSTFAEEFLVDVAAEHTPDGRYLIEHDTLVNALTLAEPAWYDAIAETTNENVVIFGR